MENSIESTNYHLSQILSANSIIEMIDAKHPFLKYISQVLHHCLLCNYNLVRNYLFTKLWTI